jgi:hypothetical protein
MAKRRPMRRYYPGDEPYVRRGPPHWILRFIGPIVGVLTFTVLVTGIVVLWAPGSGRGTVLFLHKASFVLWFGAMTVHVLGHVGDTLRLSLRDWVPARRSLPGTGLRRTALLTSLVVGSAAECSPSAKSPLGSSTTALDDHSARSDGRRRGLPASPVPATRR